MSALPSVVIHGHFYQPPRENPWTGLVEAEASAAPDHDWNARINRECYAPLASVPFGPDEHDPPRLNAYNFLSFDVGPTLCTWLEREAPDTLDAMIQGDRHSLERLGHGNAIAAPYHHVILPLSGLREKRIEVKWGIADFRRRFGREPEGFWLPETAVDTESLDVLAQEGIAFTILAPHQVTRPPVRGNPVWIRTSANRRIAAFIYDGPLSHDAAFGPLLGDAVEWERRLVEAKDRDVVSIATDGETYGHHHRFGDLALGALIRHLIVRRSPRLENYASALAAHPPQQTAQLVENSSWSCAHGVERWRSDCGCRLTPKTQQAWRAPLRTAIDWLTAEVGALFDRTGDWAELERAVPDQGPASQIEMETDALRAQTSCGWFFDDFAGLEGRQVLRYAARAIELAGAEGPRLERGFLERLEGAQSNDPAAGTARDFYLSLVRNEQAA